MLAYAVAIMVPMTVPDVFRKYSELNSNILSMYQIRCTEDSIYYFTQQSAIKEKIAKSTEVEITSDTWVYNAFTSNVTSRTPEFRSLLLQIRD